MSPDPLANCCPSGLKATESTASVWPAVAKGWDKHITTVDPSNKEVCSSTVLRK